MNQKYKPDIARDDICHCDLVDTDRSNDIHFIKHGSFIEYKKIQRTKKKNWQWMNDLLGLMHCDR